MIEIDGLLTIITMILGYIACIGIGMVWMWCIWVFVGDDLDIYKYEEDEE